MIFNWLLLSSVGRIRGKGGGFLLFFRLLIFLCPCFLKVRKKSIVTLKSRRNKKGDWESCSSRSWFSRWNTIELLHLVLHMKEECFSSGFLTGFTWKYVSGILNTYAKSSTYLKSRSQTLYKFVNLTVCSESCTYNFLWSSHFFAKKYIIHVQYYICYFLKIS